MRLLLDTHIWIWGLVAPERLSLVVRQALTDPDHELWLSAVSVWEALVLIRKGRLRVTGPSGAAWVAQALARSPVHEAPLSFAIATAAEQLALDHCDPADRLIPATAQARQATLITADERLIGRPGLRGIANR